MKKLLSTILISTVLFSCSGVQEKVDIEAEKKAIMKTNREWAKSASPEQFFSFIKSDALLLAPDQPLIKGHEGIGNVLAGFQSLPGFQIAWEPQEVFVASSGDLGYSIDRILVNYNDENGNKVDLFEKGITIWSKQDDGSWKLAADIWNVDPTITSIFQ